MRPSLNYDFTTFEKIMRQMLEGSATSSTLNALKKELNSFFKDSRCKDVIYTQNDDKLFFGMSVVPDISGDQAVEIIQSDNKFRISEYYLEIDSRLLSPTLNMKPRELVAITLHEVGHVVNDTLPADEVRESIDYYLSSNNESIILSDSVHYREILAYGIKNTIHKFTSIFEMDNEELLADEFCSAYGYNNELQSAFNKIIKNGYNINSKVNNKLIVLSWVLRLYKDVKMRRIPALKQLNNAKQLTGSRLEKREIENVLRRLNRIDDDALIESAGYSESALDAMKDKYSNAIKQIKYKGIRSLEDDLFEYTMRCKNVEDEDEALYLLRAINTRLSIIDDYVSTEKLDEKEQKRWFDLCDRFNHVRDELVKKDVYKNKQFGIIVQYPDIKPNRG